MRCVRSGGPPQVRRGSLVSIECPITFGDKTMRSILLWLIGIPIPIIILIALFVR